MKVLNLLWKFSTGGIGKCFITYSQCGLDDDIEMTSVCIVPNNSLCDRSFLIENNILQIYIKNRRDLSWIRQLYKLIKKLNPDIIFTHGLYGPIIVEVTKFFHPSIRKIPMIVSFHGLYNPPTKTMLVFAPLFNKVMAWICKYRASKIIIVSKYAGEYLLQQGVSPEKLKLVYNGISEEMPYYIPIQLPQDSVNIGFIGRIDKIKGLEYLLKSASLLKGCTKRKYHLFLIGDGPETRKLQLLVKKLDIENIVDFVGYQSNITAWLNSLDIFVLPSLQENHSIALLEAMRAGKAIVCTAVGGNVETVTDEKDALLVPCKDINVLTKSLHRLIESQELRTQLGRCARDKFLKIFTEKQTIKNTVEVFKQFLC